MKFLPDSSFWKSAWFFFLMLAGISTLSAGDTLTRRQPFWDNAPSFQAGRFYPLVASGSLAYAGISYWLYEEWYKDYPRSSFHFFNDWGEWEHMDKAGHLYTAWMEGNLSYRLGRWSGLSRKKAILTGIVAGSLFQSTVELMDGFSEKWGFSSADIGANTMGTTVFVLQQWFWDEQRIRLKFSAFPRPYPTEPIPSENGDAWSSAQYRSENLFGTTIPSRLLKDYNGQTYWISIQPEDFFGESRWPDWLSVAVGYSPGNIYGGFSNRWTREDGAVFDFDEPYPRYHQFLIAPDIDWTSIPTESAWLRSLCELLNLLKVPAPALEINTLDGVSLVWHWVYF